jgi:hypothetical protein
MSKQHLNAFAIAARSLESLGLDQGTSNVASSLVHVPRDPAGRHVRTAFWFKRAPTAIRPCRLIADRMIGTNMTGGRQRFASWACINVLFLVKPEFVP